jgi:vacuolar protein sorting-associated protein 13A/C
VSKLHLSANWRHLSSKPVRVELSGVYVVAVPTDKANIDIKAEQAQAMAHKLAKLQGMEDLRFGETDAEESNPESYGNRMATKIIDNLEIVLKDIHIRYEDFAGPHPPTSFGIGLQELTANTTDENWKPAFLADAKKTFKTLTMTNLFAYMNVQDTAGAAASAAAALAPKDPNYRAASPLSVDTILRDPSTGFLLRPVSGHLKAWMNKEVYPHPRVWIDSQLDTIGLQLSEFQYTELLGLIQRISSSHSGMSELMQSFQEHFRMGTIDERKVS